LLGSVDLGLPVDELNAVPSAEGATFLDARMATTGKS
jgi:hypothetical protein